MLDRSDGISLRSGFLHHSSLRPDSPAIAVRGVSKSYGELEQTARRWAYALTAIGDRVDRVGLFAYRSEVAYTGTLAALLSGATYVPLNPTYPDEKTLAMIKAADLDALIVDSTCLPHLSDVSSAVADIPLLIPEFDKVMITGIHGRIIDKGQLAQARVLDQLPAITPEDTAYLLFTSGSTGAPKGVPVEHGNVLHFLDVMSRRYHIQTDDRFSQTFDQTFDLSVFDLFMAWSNGASIYGMAPVDLLSPTKYINRNEITVWFSVPSVPAQMCRRNTLKSGSLPTLRWSLFCGEPLTRRSAEMWQQAAPNSIVENLYGPTELTIACFLHRWHAETSPGICRNDIVPIGRPYDGLAAMVIDAELRPVGDGEPGELAVSGPQTTPGYWRAPELTAKRYVDLSVSRYQTRRFYRTGDLVIKLAEGDYVFLGRTDDQIKVLGHRVELGEIEAVLRRHPDVENAVAFGWPIDASSADGIVAFVSGNYPSQDALFALARQALPAYVVPREIIMVEQMPLNANGKVNRAALRERLIAQCSEIFTES